MADIYNKNSFNLKEETINAIWDNDAEVFYSDSNITGLHIEAETLVEFNKLVKDLSWDILNMKKEYDLTNAEQGKFYIPIEELNIP